MVAMAPRMTPADAARGLAARLDRGADAADLLARNCAYLMRGRLIRGSDAIMASYDAAHADAIATFDAVAYESSVRPDDADPSRSAIIRYVDLLTKGGVTHRHECEQRITIDPETPGVIVRIEHIDLPGHREALNEFLARVGLPTRPID